MTAHRSEAAPAGTTRVIVAASLAEDLGALGDISASLIDPAMQGSGSIVAREDGVLAGRACVDEVYRQLDPSAWIEWDFDEGDQFRLGSVVAHLGGRLRSLLTGERTALNFLGHLSGIASATHAFVAEAQRIRPHSGSSGSMVHIRDTRKTTPGLRALEKAAVRAGGGRNHRGDLSSGVLIKDNHLAGLTIAEAIDRAKEQWPGHALEVECDTIDQVAEALRSGAEVILLDNMSLDEVEACVMLARGDEVVGSESSEAQAGACAVERRKDVLLEVSGGIRLANVAAYAATGVDLIAVGRITHSAPAIDFSMEIGASEPGPSGNGLEASGHA